MIPTRDPYLTLDIGEGRKKIKQTIIPLKSVAELPSNDGVNYTSPKIILRPLLIEIYILHTLKKMICTFD